MKLKLFFLMLFFSSGFFLHAQAPFFNEYITDFSQSCGNAPSCGSMVSAYNSKTVLVPEQGYYSITIKGTASGSGAQSPVLMRIDTDGNVVFTKEVASSSLGISGTLFGTVEAAEIADMVYSDGFLYVVGSNKWSGNSGTRSSSLSKIDLSGQEVWNTIFTTDVNGSGESNFIVNDIEIVKDEIFYVGTKFAENTFDSESALMFGKLTLDGDEIESHAYVGSESNQPLRGLTLTPNQAPLTNFHFYIGASAGDQHYPVVLAAYVDGTIGYAGLLPDGNQPIESHPNIGFYGSNAGMILPIKNNNDDKNGDPVVFYREDLSLNSFTAVRLNLAAPSLPMQAIEVSFQNFDDELAGLQLIDAEVTKSGAITTILNKNFSVELGQTYVSNSMLGSNNPTVTKLIDDNSRVNSLFKTKGNGYVIGGIVEEQVDDPSNFLLTYTEGEFCRNRYALTALQKEISFLNFSVTKVPEIVYEIENVQKDTGTIADLNTVKADLCPVDTFPCFVSAPTGLWCEQSQDGTELNWNSVSGAATYTISFYTDDPDCCCNTEPGPGPLTIEGVETSSYLFPATGPDCFAWTVTANCPDGTSSAESEKMCFNSEFQDCFAPEDIDCGEECLPPTGLTCTEVSNGILLEWNEVSEAQGYIVTITPNDEDCCCESELLPLAMTIIVPTNEYLFPACLDCFSWTVETICPDKTNTEPSEKMCYSTEEEGCFEPGTVDCEEECCTDTYGQGCVAITLAPNCQSVTFTLDPNCLPDLPGCTVDYIEWFAEVHIENSPMVIGNLTFTWNIDLLDLPITEAHYLVGYATVHLTDGTVCRIADQLLIGPGTNNCAGLIGDGEQNKSSKDSGDMVDSNLESLIHPNPVLKGSSIQLSHLNLLDARKLEVINMSGVVLLESDANRSELNIPEDFTSGIYYLKVLTNGESRIYKFLVE